MFQMKHSHLMFHLKRRNMFEVDDQRLRADVSFETLNGSFETFHLKRRNMFEVDVSFETLNGTEVPSHRGARSLLIISGEPSHREER